MVAFSTVKVGDVLYECSRQKMGNTKMSRTVCWPIRIIEVHSPPPDGRRPYAVGIWNGNTDRPRIYPEFKIARLRRTEARERR